MNNVALNEDDPDDQPMSASYAMERLIALREACNDFFSIADMTASTTFEGEGNSRGIVFSPQDAYSQAFLRPSDTATKYINEPQLRMIRARSRAFCALSTQWIAIKENRINYCVGKGHTYNIVPRDSSKDGNPKHRAKIARRIETFFRVNKYRTRQGEKLTRKDRDGEYFLRYYRNNPDGILRVRFVEPILVATPPGFGPEGNIWFGIQFDGDDYEEATRYFVRSATYDGGQTDKERSTWRRGVSSPDIQHGKANVDLGSPRGLPTTYALQAHCEQAESTLRSMGRLVDVRARIAVIRKQVNATISTISPILMQQRRGRDAWSPRSIVQYPYGSILDTNDQRSFEFPSQNIETDKIVHSLAADLQSVCAAVGFADFVLNADSRSAFGGALLKQGPMAMSIVRKQQELIDEDIEVLEEDLKLAIENDQLPDTALDDWKIEVSAPDPSPQDVLPQAQAKEILVRNEAISRRQMGIDFGYNPDDQQREVEAQGPTEAAKFQAEQAEKTTKMTMAAKADGSSDPPGNGNRRSGQAKKVSQGKGRGVPAGKEASKKANPTGT